MTYRATMNRVVITGIGTVSPLGLNTEAFWANLLAGECGLRRIDLFDPSGFTSPLGGQVPAYKIAQEVPKSYRKATKVMARDIELAVLAAKDAFASAGLKSKADDGGGGEPDFDPSRFGCNVGAGLISCELDELTYALDKARSAGDANAIDWEIWGRDGLTQLTPLWLLKYLPNMLASHVTIVHGLTGPSNSITCAEASGHLSIGEAFRTIQRGKADLMIAGGAESMLNPMAMMRHQLLGRLTESDEPTTAVRPFAPDASGTVAAEGGTLLILEAFERAKARGATIYAEVAGFGASQDTFDSTLPDPEGKAYAAACRAALRDARADAADVDVLVPHGMAIPHHDAGELAGLRRVFGDDLKKPLACPIQAQVGVLAAGCALDVATAAFALHTGRIPPAPNTPATDLNVAATAREAQPKVALAPVFGLGGQNAALVLRKV